jgi:hypothetical protein
VIAGRGAEVDSLGGETRSEVAVADNRLLIRTMGWSATFADALSVTKKASVSRRYFHEPV